MIIIRDMKARECKDPTPREYQPILVAREARDNVCGLFKLLLEIDKRNNPAFYENQKSRNHPHTSL
jgi:hypothetical protein